eukprot:9502790-Pyramimonas_sp.AAC.1
MGVGSSSKSGLGVKVRVLVGYLLELLLELVEALHVGDHARLLPAHVDDGGGGRPRRRLRRVALHKQLLRRLIHTARADRRPSVKPRWAINGQV